ncbi:uncharacterized protein LOC129591223 [Paramacrobiotus metropolitanus]|uniref:uncharacterized protein LOC129591223 n=1 Tax=Paramacrobiotus metropolitanus TaxID=2943436 RepID=UPI002446509E|nr:uncharacterized protein LOC129591223 [Paramacrobiotus metropolitanus]
MDKRNGHGSHDLVESLPANFNIKQAILQNADLTKDLEEQISNVEIAEHITSRSSFDAASNGIDNQSPCSSRSSKMIANISPVSTRARRMIEPISEAVLPVSNRIAHNIAPLKRNLQRCETTVVSSNRNTSNLSRYHSMLGDANPVKTRGSLTSSDEENTEKEKVDPVSFSATGATISSSATQTPEDMNSSDSEFTDEEADKTQINQPAPARESTSESSGDSTSETEEWDSEADTHTSTDENDDPERQPKPSYYQVIDPAPLTMEKPHSAQRPQNGRSLKEQYVASLPWMRRPAFSSMQFPSVNTNNHPRRAGMNAIPPSHSFPQEFFQMVSNPFFNTSLHEAYRQACAFKDWYEANFPEQSRHEFVEEQLVNGQVRKSANEVIDPASSRKALPGRIHASTSSAPGSSKRYSQ